MGAQVAVFFFGHPEVEGAGDLPSSKHHFSGDGLGQALAFPGEMAAHGADGTGDGPHRFTFGSKIIFVGPGHVRSQAGGNPPEGHRQDGEPREPQSEGGFHIKGLLKGRFLQEFDQILHILERTDRISGRMFFMSPWASFITAKSSLHFVLFAVLKRKLKLEIGN